MKKFKGVLLPPAPPMELEDPRFSFKYLSLMQDYEQLKKETEAKRKKLETMREKKSTLSAEVRFLRQRHHQLTQNQSLKPKPLQNYVQSHNSVTRKKNTSKARNLRPPVPRSDLNQNRKGTIYNGKETALHNISPTFDLNHKQRTSKQIVSQNSYPLIDLNQKKRVYSGKEAATRSMTPVFDLNQISLSNYSSMEGVLYCKPHFEQLFKETGNFNKNFHSPAKSAEKLTPVFRRSPSKAAGMFSGTQEKCATCGKTAYPLEKREVEEELQANGEPTRSEDLKRSLIRDVSDEQLNEMKLSACRTIGNGPNRNGKRKISWQDQVALRV